jgi:GMP synthase-like glutamine amidotransferase
MILLLDLCYERESLSKYEFVYPIADTLKRAGAKFEIQHFTQADEKKQEEYSKIILCGTALKDNAYAKRLDLFSWLKTCEKPVLGICAGMQVIGSVFGGCMASQMAIGLETLEIVAATPLLGEPRQIQVYHLHNFSVTMPEGFLLAAGSAAFTKAFKHREKPIYGIIFHPEVRNRWVLERFLKL